MQQSRAFGPPSKQEHEVNTTIVKFPTIVIVITTINLVHHMTVSIVHMVTMAIVTIITIIILIVVVKDDSHQCCTDWSHHLPYCCPAGDSSFADCKNTLPNGKQNKTSKTTISHEV
jgi:hypothetical protein